MKKILFPIAAVFSVLLTFSSINAQVGIGTTSPESKLHIKDANTNANASPLIIEANSNYGSSTYSGIEFRSHASSAGAGPSGRIKSYYTSPLYSSARMTFQTITAGPAFVDAMTLTNGSVGIGTSAPVNKLDVAGGLAVGGAYAGANTAPANGALIEGNLGVGISSPESKVHIKNANTNSNSSPLIIEANSNYGSQTYSGIEFRSNAGSAGAGPSGRIISYKTSPLYTDATIAIQTIAGGPSFVDAMLLTNGNVGIGVTPTQKLDVAGTIHASNLNGGATTLSTDASGNIIRTPSDANLKYNIADVNAALNKVMQMHGVTYNFKDAKRFGNNRQMGFLAQELEKVVPEAVSSGGEYKSVNYQVLTALLTEGIKEQQKQIDYLHKENSEFKARLEKVEKAFREQQKLLAQRLSQPEAHSLNNVTKPQVTVSIANR